MKIKIMLALIHNNNEQRNAYLRPRLAELSAMLSNYFDVNQAEISYQAQLVPHSLKVSIYRELICFQLMNAFYSSNKIGGRNKIKEIIGFLRHIAKRYFLYRGKDLVLHQRKSATEVFVTDKHISAWRNFLDSDSDILLCFEDDVILPKDSARELVTLLEQRIVEMCIGAEFIDLAGSFDIQVLDNTAIKSLPNQRLNAYFPGFSNTACSYLLTKGMAKLFYAELGKNALLRLIAVDWLINKLFILLSKSNDEYHCFHAKPPYFLHGSASGAYLSWTSSDSASVAQ